PVGVGALAGALADPDGPGVADQPLLAVEGRFLAFFSLVLGGPPDDELDSSAVLRRAPDVVEAGVEVVGGEVGHPSMMQVLAASMPAVACHIGRLSHRSNRVADDLAQANGHLGGHEQPRVAGTLV